MTEETAIQFEDYLTNVLSNAEKLDFEKKLAQDDVLFAQFVNYKETFLISEHHFSAETAHFKNVIKQAAANNQSKKEVSVFTISKKWYAVAATIVVFIAVWFFNPNTKATYSDYNSHELAQFVERSDTNTFLLKAQNSFNAKNYQETVAVFEKLDIENNPALQLYYGISLLETNNYTKADSIFKTLSLGTSIFKQDAMWYLALSSLKQNNLTNCKIYLLQINSDSEKYEKAQKLLGELE